jgi:3-hydroxyisobutyrate dehydrogenase-like beta-hydroxyacid dehydrogenase
MPDSLGFVGLGMMGAPMAARLLKSGHRLSVYNRTKSKAEPLLTQGAVWRESPGAVARASDIVFSMVSNPAALEEVSLGSLGILEGLKKGGIHVDTSTVSPSLTRDLAQRYRAGGCFFLHSPVLGSIPQATDGILLLFAGGDEDAYRHVEPLLRQLGKQIWRFERAQQASHMKLLCNLFIAGMITTLAQALVFAQKANVDPRTLLEVIGQSQLNSPTYQRKGTSILSDNFTPRFFLEHMLKDINLMLDAAKEVGAPLPAIEVAQRLFVEAQREGFGKEDYSAVVKALQPQPAK